MHNKQTTISQAMELSEADRLQVAEAILETIDGPSDPGAAEAWDQELLLRLQRARDGKATAISWSEARKQIAGPDDASAKR